MNDFYHPAAIGSALGGPMRLATALSLTDGRAKTAGEIARAARISPSAANEHLAALADAGIVASEKHWQHVYFRIATPGIAEMIEAMDGAAMLKLRLRVVSPNVPEKLRAARTCYDHLAGPVAVAICEALEHAEIIVRDAARYRLGSHGSAWMGEMRLEIDEGSGSGTRAFAKCCLDWSERRPHLGGQLGAAILRRLLEAGLTARTEGRAMSVSSLESVLENLRCQPRP